MSLIQCREEEDSHRQLGPMRGSSSPFGALSRRGLDPIKLAYSPSRPDGRLKLTAIAFNQYTRSPGHGAYCYAGLAVFFPSDGRNHRQYSFYHPTEGRRLSRPSWLGFVPWTVTHPSTHMARRRVTSLI